MTGQKPERVELHGRGKYTKTFRSDDEFKVAIAKFLSNKGMAGYDEIQRFVGQRGMKILDAMLADGTVEATITRPKQYKLSTDVIPEQLNG